MTVLCQMFFSDFALVEELSIPLLRSNETLQLFFEFQLNPAIIVEEAILFSVNVGYSNAGF